MNFKKKIPGCDNESDISKNKDCFDYVTRVYNISYAYILFSFLKKDGLRCTVYVYMYNVFTCLLTQISGQTRVT